jgi:hypothetical protein
MLKSNMKNIGPLLSESLIQSVLKVAFQKYLVVITRRCQMCIEHAGQQFEQFL